MPSFWSKDIVTKYNNNNEIKKRITMVNLKITSQVVTSGAPGPAGKSAYQIAVDNGFVGTETEWLNQLLPFKGWYDSLSALQSDIATPSVGDYAYVKGATTSDPVKIYECSTPGTWSDSGRTVDTSSVQTFGSGENVNDVDITDDSSEILEDGEKIPTAGAVAGALGNAEFATGEKVKNVGIDDEPTAGSDNLIKSRGVYEKLSQLDKEVASLKETNLNELYLDFSDTDQSFKSSIEWTSQKAIGSDGSLLDVSFEKYYVSQLLDVPEGVNYIHYKGAFDTDPSHKYVAAYDTNNVCLGTFGGGSPVVVDAFYLLPENTAKIRVALYYNSQGMFRSYILDYVIRDFENNHSTFNKLTQKINSKTDFSDVYSKIESIEKFAVNPEEDIVSILSDIVWTDNTVIDQYGLIKTYSFYKTSQFIEVDDTTKYIHYKGAVDTSENHKHVAAYDVDKNCLAVFRDGPDVNTRYELPKYTKYIRVGMYDNYIATCNIDFVNIVCDDNSSIVLPTEETLNERYLLVPDQETSQSFKNQIEWIQGNAINSNGILENAFGTWALVSQLLEIPENTKYIHYYGAFDTQAGHKHVAAYDANGNCLETFGGGSPSWVDARYELPIGTSKIRVAMYDQFVSKCILDYIIVTAILNPTTYQSIKRSLVPNQWYGKIMAAFGASNTYVGTYPWPNNVADNLGATMRNFAKTVGNRRCSNRNGTDSIYGVPNGATKVRVAMHNNCINMSTCILEWIDDNDQAISFKSSVSWTDNTKIEANTGTVTLYTGAKTSQLLEIPSRTIGVHYVGLVRSGVQIAFYDENDSCVQTYNEMNGEGPICLAGISATIEEMQAAQVSPASSWENLFTDDLDLVVFGEFAGESWAESNVTIDGTTYLGGLELLNILVGPTSSNKHYTYSDGTTLASHRNSYVGAIIYLLDKLWTLKPTCRVVFVGNYVRIQSNLIDGIPQQKGVGELAEKVHLPYIPVYKILNFNYYNNDVYMTDSEHQSDAGNVIISNIVTHEFLLIS
jgi:hypothetical protein